jgi:hypothetical protein
MAPGATTQRGAPAWCKAGKGELGMNEGKSGNGAPGHGKQTFLLAQKTWHPADCGMLSP